MPEPARETTPPWLSAGRDAVTLRVIARPGAPRVGIVRVDPRGMVIGVKSAAERGRANEELVQTLARMAGVQRSAVKLTAGSSGRQKSIRITTHDPLALAPKLRALAAGADMAR